MRNWRPHRRYSALTTAGGGVLLTKPQDGTAIVVRDLDAPTMSIALFPSVVVACVAGVLLAIAAGAFACARAQAKVRRMTDALDHMSQGLCMFDAAGRIVICNRPYLRMYKLSPDVVKPGCTLRELIEHRQPDRIVHRRSRAILQRDHGRRRRRQHLEVDRARERWPHVHSINRRCRTAAGYRRTRTSPNNKSCSNSATTWPNSRSAAARSTRRSRRSAPAWRRCSRRSATARPR